MSALLKSGHSNLWISYETKGSFRPQAVVRGHSLRRCFIWFRVIGSDSSGSRPPNPNNTTNTAIPTRNGQTERAYIEKSAESPRIANPKRLAIRPLTLPPVFLSFESQCLHRPSTIFRPKRGHKRPQTGHLAVSMCVFIQCHRAIRGLPEKRKYATGCFGSRAAD